MTTTTATRTTTSTSPKCDRNNCPNRATRGYKGYCRKHARALNKVAPRVDVTASRTIINNAHNRGLTYREIGRLTNISPTTIRNIHDGDYTTIRQATETSLRAIENVTHTPYLIDALPTARRIQALRAAGYHIQELSDLTGINREALSRTCSGRNKYVWHQTRDAVHTFYDQHANDPVRPPTPAVARHNWPKPLDWTNIDDPNENPTPNTTSRSHSRSIPITNEHRDAAHLALNLHGSRWAAGRAINVSADILNLLTTTTATGNASRRSLQKILDHADDIRVGAINITRPLD